MKETLSCNIHRCEYGMFGICGFTEDTTELPKDVACGCPLQKKLNNSKEE